MNNIKIVSNPVWSESNVKFSYKDEGSSSKVGDYNSFKDKTETLSIDDLVDLKKLDKVDFIKMDIEGAEVPALNGAINTIKKYKPTTAGRRNSSVNAFTELTTGNAPEKTLLAPMKSKAGRNNRRYQQAA